MTWSNSKWWVNSNWKRRTVRRATNRAKLSQLVKRTSRSSLQWRGTRSQGLTMAAWKLSQLTRERIVLINKEAPTRSNQTQGKINLFQYRRSVNRPSSSIRVEASAGKSPKMWYQTTTTITRNWIARRTSHATKRTAGQHSACAHSLINRNKTRASWRQTGRRSLRILRMAQLKQQRNVQMPAVKPQEAYIERSSVRYRWGRKFLHLTRCSHNRVIWKEMGGRASKLVPRRLGWPIW